MGGWGRGGWRAVPAGSQAVLTGHYIPNKIPDVGGAGLEEGDWAGRSGAGRQDAGGREGHRQGVTVAGGAARPLARVRAGRGRAGQPLAGHGAVEAEAAAAGIAGRGEVLLVAGGGRAGPWAAGGGWGGCGERAHQRGPGTGLRGDPQ